MVECAGQGNRIKIVVSFVLLNITLTSNGNSALPYRCRCPEMADGKELNSG